MAIGSLRPEPLVHVIVRAHHDFGARVVEDSPQLAHRLHVAVGSGREERMMPVGDSAPGAARRQIGAKPDGLR